VKLLDVFPRDTYPPIRYPIAMTAGAGADASRFVEFVTGKRAAVIFQNYGFELIATVGQAASAIEADPCSRFTWDVSRGLPAPAMRLDSNARGFHEAYSLH
jgi:hypothetical protein